jgi:anaerobic dimethyl sulfoxide reductase subunit B (iron-sulfur subunit)
MTQYAFSFDGTRCTGCKTCELACKDYKDLSKDFAYRKIFEYSGGTCVLDSAGMVDSSTYVYYISMSCNHCDNPACTKVCPTGAMHKDSASGLVSVDTTKCIGCGYCHMACPYDAPKVDREKGHSVKCDGCMDRVAEGKRPICVEACPLRALDFGPVETMKAKQSFSQADIAPLPGKSYTDPNFFIKACDDAKPAGSVDGLVMNPLEVQ